MKYQNIKILKLMNTWKKIYLKVIQRRCTVVKSILLSLIVLNLI